MERDEVKNRARKAARARKVGKDACCILCGETAPEVLDRKPRSHIQKHHVLGKAHDGEITVPVCLNCHAKIHERYRDNDVNLSSANQAQFLEILSNILNAIGTFLQQLGQTLIDCSVRLCLVIQHLDLYFPKWREKAVKSLV